MDSIIQVNSQVLLELYFGNETLLDPGSFLNTTSSSQYFPEKTGEKDEVKFKEPFFFDNDRKLMEYDEVIFKVEFS